MTAMDTQKSEPKTWPELAIGLFDQLTKRNAEIAYHFEDLDVEVPSRVGGDAPRARWTVKGTLRITTKDNADSR